MAQAIFLRQNFQQAIVGGVQETFMTTKLLHGNVPLLTVNLHPLLQGPLHPVKFPCGHVGPLQISRSL